MADATARFRIEGEDATGGAFRSVQVKMEGLVGASKALGKALKFGVAGLGGLSLLSFARDASAMARSINEAVTATNNLADARAKLGKYAQGISDDELRRLSEFGQQVSDLDIAFDRLGATLLAKVAPGLTAVANSARIAAGGSDIEKIRREIELLEAANKRPTRFTPPDPDRLARLRAQLANTPSGLSLAETRGKKPADETKVFSGGAVAAGKPPPEAAAYTSAYSLGFGQGKGQEPISLQGMADYGKEMAAKIQEGFSTIDLSAEIKAGVTAPLEAELPQLSVYAEQGARNMQDSLAAFLFDPFQDGLQGMVKGFADALRQMIAQAAAAKIFEVSGITGFLGGLFGGFRAEGGSVSGGRAYVVGERGPELFVPGASGAIVPNGGGSGGMVFAPTINVDSRSDRQQVLSDVSAILQAQQRQFAQQLARYNPGLRF